jgi:hypothetical protein
VTGVCCYTRNGLPYLENVDRFFSRPCAFGDMTSEQAAQLIDNTLDLVHQRLLDLESQSMRAEQNALAAEFREWRQPIGGHIDLMVFPGLANS